MLENNYYKNGQIKQEVENDILKYFFKNGKIKAVGLYMDNKMMGEWKFYRETGELWQIGNFKDNMKHGKWIRYNKEGQIEYEEEFINNTIVKKKSNTLL